MEHNEVQSLKHCCFAVLLDGYAADFSDISTAQFSLANIISSAMNEDLQWSFFQYCVAHQRMNDTLYQIFSAQCPNIKFQTQLILRSCDITDTTLHDIQNNFSNLKIFDVSGCISLTQTGFNCLPALTSLTALNLSNTNITDESLRALSVLSSLQSLNVLGCPHVSYTGVVPLLLSLNNIANFECESHKFKPQLYHDEERYYKADSDDESDDEDDEEDEEDEFI